MPELDTFFAQGCFALLDDQQAGHAASRLYTGHVTSLPIPDSAALEPALQQMQSALARGLHAVMLLSHELGGDLHNLAPRPTSANVEAQKVPTSDSQILLFKNCQRLMASGVADWLRAQAQHAQASAPPTAQGQSVWAGASQAGIADVRRSVSRAEFDAAIAHIHRCIEAGDCYQVNYTYRLHFRAYGSPLSLYARLRARQPVPFGALISLPDGRAVLSLSPELLVKHEQGLLEARPMKGTAPASQPPNDEEDARRADALAQDAKNRAENVMIVDLLRNDLSRVAEPCSVTVPRQFEVQRFGQVLQMTSTVQARLRPQATLAETVRAIFPCGSIAGAPKRRALQIIRELEPDARGLYTGTIGWFEPTAPQSHSQALAATTGAAPAVGDFCLSVPIRTLLLDAPEPGSGGLLRNGQMGVGAGIVHDSRADEEWQECLLKASFLTSLQPEFELFETMHASRENGCMHVARHLARLAASARSLGFAFNEPDLRNALQAACAEMPPGQPHRLRLALQPDGRCSVQSAVLQALAAPVRFSLASETTQANDLFLAHKTTLRARYDKAWKTAEASGAFDQLFFNAEGELTEGGRSNVFVKLAGRWYTPPLASGVLPGVMRSVLLEDSTWAASERRLDRADLLSAEAVVLCNALRGVMPAELLTTA